MSRFPVRVLAAPRLAATSILAAAATTGAVACSDHASGSPDAAPDAIDDGADGDAERSDSGGGDAVGDARRDEADDALDERADGDVQDAPGDMDSEQDAPPPPALPPLRVVTFNTGSSTDLAHDAAPDDGYSRAQAAVTDTWYGNGLAWLPFVERTRAFFDRTDADIVALQEIFWSGDCVAVPDEARTGYVCESWRDGDPTVAQQILGDGWQVACHPGKPDKCLAVRRSVGSIVGCDGDLCLDGLAGSTVAGCGRGARVGRATVALVSGATIGVVSFHGTSGISAEEQQCRVSQIAQVFDDIGDGEPGASGDAAIILGDLNTDPWRLRTVDASAAEWLRRTDETGFDFVTDVGPDAAPTYAGRVNIDHVLSDGYRGSCSVPGVTEGVPAVLDGVFFDHKPIVCELEPR